MNLQQARRHGGFPGLCFPKSLLVLPQTRIMPPKRGLCPKELTGSVPLECSLMPETSKILVITRVRLNLNFEFEFAHELLMNLNLNSTFAKSLNLNLVFSKSMNLNLKIKNKWMDPSSAVANGGGRGAYSANGRLCPLFGLLKILLW